MNLWKETCRALEDPKTRAVFGDLSAWANGFCVFDLTPLASALVTSSTETRLGELHISEIELPFPRCCFLILAPPDGVPAFSETDSLATAVFMTGIYGRHELSAYVRDIGSAGIIRGEIEIADDAHGEPQVSGSDVEIARLYERGMPASLAASMPSESEFRTWTPERQRAEGIALEAKLNNLRAKIWEERVYIAALCGIRAALLVNQPTHYIVREAPQREPRTAGVRRLGERDRYILLTPLEIKTRWQSAHPGTHASPIPHTRRGHFRVLSAPRFRHKRGLRLWIRPMKIIGKDIDWTEGGRRYTVT